ncbi:MAG: dipeptidase [Bacteroidota bacterium]
MIKKICFFLLLTVFFTQGFAQGNKKLAKKAGIIHSSVLTLDSHTDTPLRFLRDSSFNPTERHDPKLSHSKIDFPRMVEGGMDAVFFAAFIGQGPRTTEGNIAATEQTKWIIEGIHDILEKYPGYATAAFSADDAARIKKSGKRAVYIGIENGYAIGSQIAMIDTFYTMGVRYITLCHTKNNDICDSSTDSTESGLTGFGKEVVMRMNSLGVMIDVSHISDQAFFDVLKTTKTPVIASHSSVRAVCEHPRNFSDSMLYALKENGGVIQICILSDYVKKPDPNPGRDSLEEAVRKKYKGFINLSEEEMQNARRDWYAIDDLYPPELATVSDAVDHIDYVVKLIGIDYVGIGTDFDGGGGLADCYDVSQMGNITIELVKRGYTKEQIEKIWGGNFLRVFREVEKQALQN